VLVIGTIDLEENEGVIESLFYVYELFLDFFFCVAQDINMLRTVNP
jgi:hypothetical protein